MQQDIIRLEKELKDQKQEVSKLQGEQVVLEKKIVDKDIQLKSLDEELQQNLRSALLVGDQYQQQLLEKMKQIDSLLQTNQNLFSENIRLHEQIDKQKEIKLEIQQKNKFLLSDSQSSLNSKPDPMRRVSISSLQLLKVASGISQVTKNTNDRKKIQQNRSQQLIQNNTSDMQSHHSEITSIYYTQKPPQLFTNLKTQSDNKLIMNTSNSGYFLQKSSSMSSISNMKLSDLLRQPISRPQENQINIKNSLLSSYRQLPEDKKLIIKFRRSILKNKFLLYESDTIQIGFLCDQLPTDIKSELHLTMCFTNISQASIRDFKFKILSNQICQVMTIQDNFKSVIEPNAQVQQVLSITYKDIPYTLVQGELRYASKQQQCQIRIILPNTFNRYMESRDQNIVEFLNQWMKIKNQYNTQEFDLDEIIASNLNELINKYFPEMVLLDKQTQLSFGGIYYIRNTQSTVLLKINGIQNKIKLVIGSIEQGDLQDKVSQFILEHLLLALHK